jgi:hypothetical protein
MVLKMQQYSFEMIHLEGATHALPNLTGRHHEVLDEKLAASVE